MVPIDRTTPYSRADIAAAIVARFDADVVAAARQAFAAAPTINYFVVDDLLPELMARAIYADFPAPSELRERNTLRERKYVTSQMDQYAAQLEEAVFAFHDDAVVAAITAATGLRDLSADAKLYAGGISVMARESFLNPHLDNSHDHDRALYRTLNLLYYCSPGWRADNGGNLEIWPNGVKGEPTVLPSLFNRLVVMSTGGESWHSVSRIEVDAARCCVSNYYFSPSPLGGKNYSRVTSFRGRPEEPVRDLVLRADASARQFIRRLRPAGLIDTGHLYQRPDEPGDA